MNEDAESISTSENDLLQTMRRQIIGSNSEIHGPFGSVPLVYADWTASGRSLMSIEKYISDTILPLYGNTHTTTSISGNQSTCFRDEARQIVAEYFNAKITGRASQDCVIFCGNGTTSAVSKLVELLGLKENIGGKFLKKNVPVVFIGPFEHHSNILPWRESYVDVVMIRNKRHRLNGTYETSESGLDLDHLEEMLQKYNERKLKIGAFNAASNITGQLTDTNLVSALLHRYGALSCWDCATAAPHMKIDMNPVVLDVNRHSAYKDAIYFSGHKFLGGPSTPGVLIFKRSLLNHSLKPVDVPTNPGGGSVFFVTQSDHRYLSRIEEREEAGTPNVIGISRLGLVIKVHHDLMSSLPKNTEINLSKYILKKLSSIENVCIMGHDYSKDAEFREQLPIFSFLIRFKCISEDLKRIIYYHYNFVCALLNDLFGIQSRGGCMCAGPYAQRLMGITVKGVRQLEQQLLLKHELLRPGFTRVSFASFNTSDEIEYILHAVDFIAKNGYLFLHQYKMDHLTGDWKHVKGATKFPERKWLGNFSPYEVLSKVSGCQLPTNDAELFKQVQLRAHEEAAKATLEIKRNKTIYLDTITSNVLSNESEKLRWFAYPWEFISSHHCENHFENYLFPINPQRYYNVSSEDLEEFDWGSSLYSERYQQLSAEENAKFHPPLNSSMDEQKLLVCNMSNINTAYVDLSKCARKHTLRVGAFDQTDRELQLDACPGISSCDQLDEIELFPKAPLKLRKSVSQAITEWKMIEEGDRLCLGLSGGKDSLSLLHVLLDLQKRAPVRFQLSCATVDPQTPSFDPSPLISYMKALGVCYHYLSDGIIERARTSLQGDSLCSFCSRAKRGLLYSCCRQNNYNKLVLAQHLDDLAESFMMSLLHNGQARTMRAKYLNETGDVTVIRPLMYTREVSEYMWNRNMKQYILNSLATFEIHTNVPVTTKEFSLSAKLPVINENCPACFEQPKERARVKEMLKREESLYPLMFHSIRQALVPLMDPDIYEVMQRVKTQVSERGTADARKKERRKSTRWNIVNDEVEF